MNDYIKKILYKSFDTDLTKKEKKILEGIKSIELENEKKKINHIRDKISGNINGSFKPDFSKKIMNKIRDIKNKNQILDTFFFDFKIVAACASILCLILLILSLYTNKINDKIKYSNNPLIEFIDKTLINDLEDLL